MAAATVGRFCRARARLVGARVESAERRMDTNGLHAQFGGFELPLCIEASEPQFRQTCRAATAWTAAAAPRGIAQMCQEGRGAARGDRHGGRARSRHPQEAPLPLL